MATTITCDVCKRDCNDYGHNKYSYLVHLDSDRVGYVDRNFNAVSGRPLTFDLCNECYNVVVGASVAKFKQLQKEYECQQLPQ